MANIRPNWSGTTVYAAGRGRTATTDEWAPAKPSEKTIAVYVK
jgi:hypothetical protein